MRKTNIIADLFWVLFSAAVCLEALSLQVGGFHRPGPGFLPFWAGVVLGGLAIVSLVKTLAGKEAAEGNPWAGINFWKLGLMTAVLFAYVALLDTLGFLLGTFLLLVFLFRVVEPYRWRTVLLASVLTIGAAYGFFVALLDSRLPKGFLGF
jgi:putative tricarboxylic transport membrane protein